ncbi:hypothetical protein [Draconibacterium orientale]|uniref:hypothetical protein n=1 Tax=Draconibacterium orientale TaxID=1168034 RepID=UPI0029C08661|nr:hypothetical protein [Draconibacterium orientale]
MTELNVELPIKINGLVITEDIFEELMSLHEQGSANEYNSGITLHTNSIMAAITLIIGFIAEGRDKSKYAKEIDVISELYYINESLSRLKLPDQFLPKAG